MKYREKMKKLKAIVREGDFSDDMCEFVKKCTKDKRVREYAEKIMKYIEECDILTDRIYELREKEKITESDIDFLEKAALSIYNCDRCDVAEILINAEGERAKKLLFKLAEDKWHITRCSAYESLYCFGDKDVYDLLMKRLECENSSLARSYIIMVLGDLYKYDNIGNAEEIVNVLKEKIKNAEGTEKIEICRLFIFTGEKQYIADIFNELENEDHNVRVWALSALRNVADEKNCTMIYEKVKETFTDEKIPCVNEQLEIFYEELGELCKK